MIGANYGAVSRLEKALVDTDAKTTEDVRNDMLSKFYREHGQLILKRTQDVEPYLDSNKRKRNAVSSKSWRRVGRKLLREVAEIPNIVIEHWLKQGFNCFRCSERELRRKLDDPEWSYLKTVPWKLGQRSRHI